MDKGLSPIFELVGPNNRVVVKYSLTDLILIRLRNNVTGEYVDIEERGLNIPHKYNFSLRDLISLKSELIDMEGWIVEFLDGQKVKIKTDWYLSLHRIYTDYSQREDYLIDLILDEKIDDILSTLEDGCENKIFVEKVIKQTYTNILSIRNQVDEMLIDYDGDRKLFAQKYKNHKYFPISVKCLSNFDKHEIIKDYIKKTTYRLGEARNWLSNC